MMTLKMHFPKYSRPARITFNKVYGERKILEAGILWLSAENYCFSYNKIAQTITLSCNYR